MRWLPPVRRWALTGTLAAAAVVVSASPAGAYGLGNSDAFQAAIVHAPGQHGIVLADGLGDGQVRVTVALAQTKGAQDVRYLLGSARPCSEPAGSPIFGYGFDVADEAGFARARITLLRPHSELASVRLFNGPDAASPPLACARALRGRDQDVPAAQGPDWAAASFAGAAVKGIVLARDLGTSATVSVSLLVGMDADAWRIIGSTKACAYQHHQTDLEFLLERSPTPRGTIFVRETVALASLADLRSVRLAGGGARLCKVPGRIDYPN